MTSPNAAYWLPVLCSAVFGGVVGSFLNVVVYRLPHGISLITPPSHCPICKKPIRWFDNVPVLGWIMLRGRCRHCRCPIPVRYPAVEAVTAAMFGGLAAIEMGRLQTTYPIHLLLLCTLLCAGLIEYDGNRPPWRLFIPAIVVGALAQMFWPALVPKSPAWRGLPVWLAGTPDWLVGPVVTLILVWALRKQRSTGLGPGLFCVGFCLGVNAFSVLAVAIVVIQALLWLVQRLWPKVRIPPSISLGVLTLGWILTWASLAS